MKDIFEDEDNDLKKQIDQANSSGEKIYEDLGELKQGSKAWFAIRMEKFTGSKYPDLMKGGRAKGQEWGESAFKVIKQVFIERDLTDEGKEYYIEEMFNKEFRQTKWGTKWEPFARDEYCLKTGSMVEETCFEIHNLFSFIGGSFDGKVLEQNKIIEIKCPYDPLIHAANFELVDLGIQIDHTYYPQIQCNIEVAGADSCDFISFDPRRKRDRLAIINVPRDQEFIDRLVKKTLIANKAVYYMGLGIVVEDAVLLATKDYKELEA